MNKKVLAISLATVGLIAVGLTVFALLHGFNSATQGGDLAVADFQGGCATNEGLYYNQLNERLDYLDFEDKQSVPLCNKPNCPHSDYKTCDAYMGDNMHLTLSVAYGEKLYLFAQERNGMSILRADPDGKNRTKIAETNMGSILYNAYALHDRIVFSGDIVHYKENGEFKGMGGNMVQVLDLNTNEIQTIGNTEQSLETLAYLYSQKGDLLFLSETINYTKESEPDDIVFQRYISYNVKTGERKIVLENSDKLFACAEGELAYYATKEGKQIRRFNLLTGEDVLLMEGGDRAIALEPKVFDGKLGYYTYISEASPKGYIFQTQQTYYMLDLQTNQSQKAEYQDKTILWLRRKNATPDGYIVQIAYTDGSYRLAFMTKADFDEGNTGNYVELWFQGAGDIHGT